MRDDTKTWVRNFVNGVLGSKFSELERELEALRAVCKRHEREIDRLSAEVDELRNPGG